MIKSDKNILRSGSAAQWTAVNPKLELGEIGYELDTRKLKVGDGQYRWNELSYIYTGGTGSVGGSGVPNYISKWTPDSTTLGNSLLFDDGTNVGIAATTMSARLHVKGSGNTSATNAFNIENSSGTHVFRVRDDGIIHIGPTTSVTNGAVISCSDGTDNVGTTILSGLRYRSSLTTSGTGSDHYFRNYQGSRTQTSGTANLMEFNGGFAPTSGTGVYNFARVVGTVNQTGGANGITRGIWVSPTLTAAADFRAIDTDNGPWRLTDTYAAGSGSLAGPAMVINQTWNTTGTPTAFQVNVTDTASNASSLIADFRVGGSSRAQIRKNGSASFSLEVDSGSSFRVVNNSGFFSLGSTPDTYLFRDAANVLAQRNGVTAQTHRIYNTYTDASNYERGFIRWSTNVLQIGGEAAGTGSSRDLQLFTGGTAKVTVDTTGRVGVGITVPTGYMHLVAPSGAGYANLIHLVKSGGFGTGWVDIQYTGGTFESFLCADTNTDPTAKISCWQDVWDGGNRPGSIRFYTRPSGGAVTERMRITSTGNVGIGVTTVNAPLQFPATLSSRKIVLYEVSNNDHQVYGFGIDSGTLRYQVANSAANHIFYAGATSSSSTELMRVTGTGNVGMGSTSPGARAHIITTASGAKGLIVQGVASQSATLQEWQNNSGTMLSQVLASGVFQSAVSTGTAPFIVASTTAVTNLNADLLDGQHGSYYTNYVQSRLENLVTNGSGLLGNNTNFSSFVFNAAERFAGGGSFTYNGADAALTINELIPVDIGKVHRFVYYAKLLTKSVPAEEPRHYGMVVTYDADGLLVQPYNCQKVVGSTYTSLAVDLNPGDLTITLTDATGWYSGPTSHQRTIGFHPYTNGQGYTYPAYTYTRNYMIGAWNEGGISGNVITLAVPYAGVARTAGTKVANHQSGGTYDYIAGGNVVTQPAWTKYEGIIGPTGSFYTDPVEGGVVSSTGDMLTAPGGFRHGAAFMKVGWLLSYNTPSGTAQTALSSISFGLDPRHDDYYRSVSDGTSTAPAFSFINDSNTGMFRPTTDELAFSTGAAERVRITSTGNVAIGSTSASEKLFVNAGNVLLSSGYGIRCSDNFRLYDTTNSIDRFIFSANNQYNTRPSGSHVFQVNGTQLAVLNSSGNMGIGVSTPTAKLDVTGSQVSGFSLLLRSGDASGGTDSVQVGFGYDNSSDYRHSIRTRHNSASPTGNAIDFWLWQQGTDAAATLGSLRVVTIDGSNGGSVGIGTTSPSRKLHVNGDIQIDQQIFSVQSYTGFLTTAGAAQPVKVGSLAITSSYGNNAPTNGLYVQGDVGIGTTSPATKLHVIDNVTGTNSLFGGNLGNPVGIKIYNLNTASNSFITLGEDAGVSNTPFYIERCGSTHATTPRQVNIVQTTAALTFQTSTTERMRITSGGSVGIGTTSPSVKLDVNGGETSITSTSANPTLSLTNTAASNDPYIRFKGPASSPTYAIGIDSSDSNKFKINGGYLASAATLASSNIITITEYGLVGLGTTNPAAKLEVNGVAYFRSGANAVNIHIFNYDGVGSEQLKIGWGSTGSNQAIIDVQKEGAGVYRDLVFKTSNTERVKVAADGIVDIKNALRLSGTSSGYVGLVAAAAAGSTTYTLPSADGTNGQFLRTNGSGTLSWGTATGATAYTVYSPTTTTTITELSGEVVVLADATSGSLTVNLPTAVSNTAKITVKKIDSSVNTVVIDGSSTQTIDGSSTKTIEFQYTSVTLISNGSNWFII